MAKIPPAKPDAIFTVRHGITGTLLTKPLTTLEEAEAAAIRLSAGRPHTVELWHRDHQVAWYSHGHRG